MASAGTIVFRVGRRTDRKARMVSPLFRVALLSGVFGLAGYVYYGLGLPGSEVIDGVNPGLRGFLIGFTWGLVPPLLMLALFRRAGKQEADGNA